MPFTRVSALILFLSLAQAGCGADGRGVRTDDGAVGAADAGSGVAAAASRRRTGPPGSASRRRTRMKGGNEPVSPFFDQR